MRSLLVVALTMNGCLASGQPDIGSEQYALITGQVMSFHFDDPVGATSFNDMSPVNRDASCSGSTCPAASRIGLRGTPNNNNTKLAADFDGVNDCLSIADNADHELALPFTISAWILPRALPATNTGMAIVSKYSASGNQRSWILGIRNISGTSRLYFWKSHLGTSASTIGIQSNRILTSSDLNRWMHVVLRIKYDAITGDDYYEWWIDDVLNKADHFADTNPDFFNGTSTVRIGCVQSSSSTPDMFFKGKVDELMIAKSYVSNADRASLYSWAAPLPPSMSYAAGAPLYPDGHADECRVNVGTLASRVADTPDMAMDTYRFVIRRDSLCSNPAIAGCDGPPCHDFQALREFLAFLDVINSDLKVIVEKNPFWYDIEPYGASATCLALLNREEQWGCAIAELADEDFAGPQNLVGWSIDDFFEWRRASKPCSTDQDCQAVGADWRCDQTNDRCLDLEPQTFCNEDEECIAQNPAWHCDLVTHDCASYPEVWRSFLHRGWAVNACNAVQDKVKIYATIYCEAQSAVATCSPPAGPYEPAMPCQDYNNWHVSGSDTQDEAFEDYLNDPDYDLDDCIAGVTMYRNPCNPDSSWNATELNTCIGNLRPLQKDPPYLEIIEGVYDTDEFVDDGCGVGCSGRQNHVTYSRATVPDGFAFWRMPPSGDSCLVGSDSYDEWISGLTGAPDTYITW